MIQILKRETFIFLSLKMLGISWRMLGDGYKTVTSNQIFIKKIKNFWSLSIFVNEVLDHKMAIRTSVEIQIVIN